MDFPAAGERAGKKTPRHSRPAGTAAGVIRRRPRFLLGVGAPRCGTTWLFSHLNKNPQIRFPPLKELEILTAHYFPGEYRNRAAHFAAKPGERGAANRSAHDLWRSAQLKTFANAHLDLSTYPDLFKPFLTAGQTRVVGEITPNYMALQKDHWAEVKQLLEGAGFAVRPVLILRDPVERMISQFGMRGLQTLKVLVEAGVVGDDDLFQRATNDRTQRVARYEQAMDSIQAVFGIDNVFFGLYEELTTEAEMRRIAQFLGVRYQPPDTQTRVNSRSSKLVISPELRGRLRTFYAPTYDACADLFGRDKISKL